MTGSGVLPPFNSNSVTINLKGSGDQAVATGSGDAVAFYAGGTYVGVNGGTLYDEVAGVEVDFHGNDTVYGVNGSIIGTDGSDTFNQSYGTIHVDATGYTETINGTGNAVTGSGEVFNMYGSGHSLIGGSDWINDYGNGTMTVSGANNTVGVTQSNTTINMSGGTIKVQSHLTGLTINGSGNTLEMGFQDSGNFTGVDIYGGNNVVVGGNNYVISAGPNFAVGAGNTVQGSPALSFPGWYEGGAGDAAASGFEYTAGGPGGGSYIESEPNYNQLGYSLSVISANNYLSAYPDP